ncbi:MAG TPA: monovalent cation/H(+) antiporter subunit G [Thermoleophilaceae bacterium]|nr:monovalent cation/H(+) antiporter subunit G [Thermoleophilaceae bacterium]
MSKVAVDVLLGLGVASVLLSGLGLLASKGPLEQLHFTGPAATVAPVAIAAAVLVEEPLSSMGVKAVLTAVILLATSPILVHATARAIRIRRHGRFVILEEEHRQKEHP